MISLEQRLGFLPPSNHITPARLITFTAHSKEQACYSISLATIQNYQAEFYLTTNNLKEMSTVTHMAICKTQRNNIPKSIGNDLAQIRRENNHVEGNLL